MAVVSMQWGDTFSNNGRIKVIISINWHNSGCHTSPAHPAVATAAGGLTWYVDLIVFASEVPHLAAHRGVAGAVQGIVSTASGTHHRGVIVGTNIRAVTHWLWEVGRLSATP